MLIVTIIAGTPVLATLLDRVGRRVAGLAQSGACTRRRWLFELVDMKGDLGALAFGALLAGPRQGKRAVQALLSLKDLFLVGFFLSIGMTGIPEWGCSRWLAAAGDSGQTA